MQFEDDFDLAKSEKTKTDRGINFLEARLIWNDENHKTIPAKNVMSEVRYGTVGKLDNKLWVALWTERNSRIRIFSVHRAEGTSFEKEYNNED